MYLKKKSEVDLSFQEYVQQHLPCCDLVKLTVTYLEVFKLPPVSETSLLLLEQVLS